MRPMLPAEGIAVAAPSRGGGLAGQPADGGLAAEAGTASGPDDSSSRKASSSRMGTPRSTALSYFEPAFSPATTKFVFFDTEDDTLPPAARTASAASSLVRPGSVPVITTVTPARSPEDGAEGAK